MGSSHRVVPVVRDRRRDSADQALAGVGGSAGLVAIAASTLVSLFAVGMALSLFTGRGAWSGALRMVLIGGGAGLVSYWVGRALGVAIG